MRMTMKHHEWRIQQNEGAIELLGLFENKLYERKKETKQ